MVLESGRSEVSERSREEAGNFNVLEKLLPSSADYVPSGSRKFDQQDLQNVVSLNHAHLFFFVCRSGQYPLLADPYVTYFYVPH